MPAGQSGAEAKTGLAEGADIWRSQKARIGQSFFRNALLAAYNGQCCVTGVSLPALLRASHIKPWAQASAEEKVNPANGLLLNALFDAAFDQGYISFSPGGKILLSARLLRASAANKAPFVKFSRCEITKPARFQPERHFLEYHNDCVFLK